MEGQLQRVFGENLRAVRLERGFSQEALAHHLGKHRTFIGSVERGERNLTLRTVERLSSALRIDALELLGAGPAPSRHLRAASSGDDPGAPRRRRAAKRPAPKPDSD